MQIWMWMVLSGVFAVTSSYCSALSLQQKNQTKLLAGETDVTDQGQFVNVTKAHGVHKKIPGFRTPLDPLSKSVMKTKNDRKRQSKTPQNWPVQKGLVEQTMPGGSHAFTVIGPVDTSSVHMVQLGESSPMQPPRTKPNDPTDRARTRVSNRRGQSGAFGLPIDRIGLGHLSHGRG